MKPTERITGTAVEIKQICSGAWHEIYLRNELVVVGDQTHYPMPVPPGDIVVLAVSKERKALRAAGLYGATAATLCAKARIC